MSYWDFEFTEQQATKPVHTLNRPYKGARKIVMRAPDAKGTLLVYARSEQEAEEHLKNALFDLIFNRHRFGKFLDNPPCIFCGGHTESRGRNSSGTQTWRCKNLECQRSFVVRREFRGGINHPSQSKKPEFARLLLSGLTVREAADRLRLNVSTAGNWAQQVAALNPGRLEILACPCGRPLRHRGSCVFRRGRNAGRRYAA